MGLWIGAKYKMMWGGDQIRWVPALMELTVCLGTQCHVIYVKSQLSKQDRCALCALGNLGTCQNPALRPTCWPLPGTSFSKDQGKAGPALGGVSRRVPRLLRDSQTLDRCPVAPRGPSQPGRSCSCRPWAERGGCSRSSSVTPPLIRHHLFLITLGLF